MNQLPTPKTTTFRRGLLQAFSIIALGPWAVAAHATEKVPVVASFSILGDIVQVIGSDRVNVQNLVGPDEDAHVFEPRPADAKVVLASKLVVTNGLNFEPWADKLLRSAGYQGARVVAAQGVHTRQAPQHGHAHSHGGIDPHAWQNPQNVMVYARNIAAGLSKLDPAGASIYQANVEAYVKELQTLDTWAKAQFDAIPQAKRKAITSHDAFGYLAAHYGLTFLAPRGVNTDADPSAKQVAQLIQQIKREKIRAVFVENMASPKLIAQLSKDAGATVGASLYADALSAPGQPGATYLQMMRHNVTQLVAGMKLN